MVRFCRVLAVVLLASGCASHTAPPSPRPDFSPRLAAADTLIRQGSLDALLEAFREYDALRKAPAVSAAATIGAIRAGVLIALRQRELGMLDEAYLAKAADLQTMLDRDPRFVEIHYVLGIRALTRQLRPGVFGPDLDEADRQYRAAYEWRQNWPSLTVAIAHLALTEEDFPRALEFFDRTL